MRIAKVLVQLLYKNMSTLEMVANESENGLSCLFVSEVFELKNLIKIPMQIYNLIDLQFQNASEYVQIDHRGIGNVWCPKPRASWPRGYKA